MERKKIIGGVVSMIIVTCSMLIVSSVSAASLDYVTTPNATYFPNEKNRVIMQFDLMTYGTEKLNAVSIQNVSIAPANYILSYNLWQDNGDGFFNQFLDTDLGVANQSTSAGSIFWMDKAISATTKTRFFITINTGTNASITQTKPTSFKLFGEDLNGNKAFDFQSDFGVYVSGQSVMPGAGVINVAESIQIGESPIDQSMPVGAIFGLTEGQKLYGKNFVLTGKAADMGGGNVANVELVIGGVAKEVSTDNGWQDWTYNWTNVNPGNYTIVLKVKDTNNNTNANAITYNVVVESSVFSPEYSSLTSTKTSAQNDAQDSITISAYLKDTEGKPIMGKPVRVEWLNGIKPDYITQDAASNEIGAVNIVLKSLTPVTATASVYYDSFKLGSVTITFVQSGERLPPVAGVPAYSGDLIKASSASVYYLGENGKRYVFPDSKTYLTWYSDFSGVKNITDAQLAMIPLGGNVTYRPGVKLIKIATDPRVYAVAPGGVLRWITSEQVAIGLYGANWGKKVNDVSDTFFTNYTLGDPIQSLDAYDPIKAQEYSFTINRDKGLD